MADPTRRAVVVSLPLLAVACGRSDKGSPADSGGDDTGAGSVTPVRDAEPAPWSPEGTEDTDAFPYGVQVGDAADSSAVVSVRTSETTVTMILVMAQDGAWQEVERRTDLPVEAGGAVVVLEGLAADTAWSVVFLAEDGAGRRSAPARFRTALGAADWRVVTFGATSCLGGNEPWPNLSHAADARYDFFCLLGDTVYADGADTPEDYAAFWDHAMRVQGMRDLSASTSLIATWDDHEIDNNWAWTEAGIAARFEAGLAAFSAHLPRSAGQGTAGIWRRLTWGTVLEVFVLECRAERDAAAGIYLSQAQLDWLKAGLSASPARFKIILNSVPITDLYDVVNTIAEDDRWSGFPEQREEILGHIAASGISGVLWVAGDVHFGAVCTVDPEGGTAAGQWEVIAGPSGSTLNIAAELVQPTAQFPVLFAAWNHTRFTCDPGLGTILVEFVGDDGVAFAAQSLAL